MGSPTVIAKFTPPGRHLAGRGAAARRRPRRHPRRSSRAGSGARPPAARRKQVFQLHPNGWTFAEGHVPKLELLPEDANAGPIGGYGRPSDDQQPVTVKQLELRLPVVEKPGSFKRPGRRAGREASCPRATSWPPTSRRCPTAEPKAEAQARAQGLEPGRHSSSARASLRRLQLESRSRRRRTKAAKKKVKVAKGRRQKVGGGKSKKLKLKLTGQGGSSPREARS